ncbi:MAG TPA: FixH family protein [Methylomirabilota bacterium]|nr:FixH family protein [Methylomirabilota bacterium]
MKPSSPLLRASGSSATADRESNRGWWYPLIFVFGLAIVIAVNGILVTTAIRSFSGLETDSAYQEGLAYNATIAAAQDQERLGWRMQLKVAPPPAGATSRTVELTASFADHDGKPLTHRSVEALFVRPTLAGHDFKVTLAGQGSGVYGAAVEAPLSGQWDVTVLARYRAADGTDRTWQTTRRLYLP